MKRLLTGTLIAGLVFAPATRPRAQVHKDSTLVEVVCAGLVIGIGIYAVFKINGLCNKLLPKDQPQTNQIPIVPPVVTNSVPTNSITNRVMVLDDSAVSWQGSLAAGQNDGTGAAVSEFATAFLQAAPSPSGPFSNRFKLELWSSANGVTARVSSADGNGMAYWIPNGGMAYVPLHIADPNSRKEFFRLLSQ